MKIYLATSSSGVKKEQRKEMIKCCRPLYLLETFYSGEKCCAIEHLPLTQIALPGRDCYLHHYTRIRGAMSIGNRYQNKRSVRKTCLWF